MYLDRKGRSIITSLLADCTVTVAQLSRTVSLTENAVRYRVDQLIERGLLNAPSYHVERSLLGYTDVCFLVVTATGTVDVGALGAARGVLACYRGSLPSSYLVVVTSIDLDDYRLVLQGIAVLTGDGSPVEVFRGSPLLEDYQGRNVFQHVFTPVSRVPDKNGVAGDHSRGRHPNDCRCALHNPQAEKRSPARSPVAPPVLEGTR